MRMIFEKAENIGGKMGGGMVRYGHARGTY